VVTDQAGRPGHAEAVAALFHRRYRALFRYLDRLTGDPDLAADLAQETFARLYRRGTLPDDPAAWLMTVATNLFRDERRIRRRRRELIARRAADPVFAQNPESTDAAVLAGETRARVRAALSALSPRDQQLLILRHEGYSYRDLAQTIGVAESSVGTLLIRATRAFRTSLPDAADGGVWPVQTGGHDASD
jgi:RNA polymerase sigma-70 factor (ECF subfamily)